jgi:NAD-dependent deacetylase
VAELRAARSVVALTGSGISAESGIPTFRDAAGLWGQVDPEDVATPRAFRRDPAGVWRWYAERRRNAAQAEPNAGHIALAELEARVPAFTLVTQNVDGLHHRAGSRTVLELHGSIARARCSRERTVFESWAEDGEPPPCPDCGAPLRPDVVWFGETLPAGVLEAAVRAAWSCDLLLSVGTSGLVEPAASLPFEALRYGATLVEVNPASTPLTDFAHFVLAGPAGRVLPALVRAVWP